ncbi:unnamed protein product [Dicrocoelium dendriticum]|nr:unnamed protein product [Dicrocoelium dendriticum]
MSRCFKVVSRPSHLLRMIARPRNSIHIKNLPDEITYNDVWTEFKKLGDIVNVTIPVDVNTAKAKGYAFVEYPLLFRIKSCCCVPQLCDVVWYFVMLFFFFYCTRTGVFLSI